MEPLKSNPEFSSCEFINRTTLFSHSVTTYQSIACIRNFHSLRIYMSFYCSDERSNSCFCKDNTLIEFFGFDIQSTLISCSCIAKSWCHKFDNVIRINTSSAQLCPLCLISFSCNELIDHVINDCSSFNTLQSS